MIKCSAWHLAFRPEFLLVLGVTLLLGVPRATFGQSVTTQGYDNNRDNVNSNETGFLATKFSIPYHATGDENAANYLHGIVYAQPLFVANLPMDPTADVLYIATEENWIYALDGNHIGKATPIWADDFNTINCVSPCTGGDTNFGPVPDASLSDNVGCTNIQPEVGITGTPVIDISSNSNIPDVIYAVSYHLDTSGTVRQYLNVVSLIDGSRVGTSIDIASQWSGFKASAENQRAALALTHDSDGEPLIYIAWAGYCDNTQGTTYSGKVGVFKATGSAPSVSLTLVHKFDDQAASGSQGGIWMGGSGLVIDPAAPDGNGQGYVYTSTGNGSVTNPYNTPLFTSSNNLGMSILQLKLGTGALAPVGAYTANEWSILNTGSNALCTSRLLTLPKYWYPSPGYNPTFCSMGDFDLDAGGLILARAVGGILPGDNDNFVVLAGGKEGVIYDLDPSIMANTVPDTAAPCSQQYGNPHGSYQTIQCFAGVLLQNTVQNGFTTQQPDSVGSRCSPAFWAGTSSYEEDYLYLAGSDDTNIWAYQMNLSSSPPTIPAGSFNPKFLGKAGTPSGFGSGKFPYPGTCPVVTWNQNGISTPDKNAVLWIMGPVQGGTQSLANNTGAKPVVITAYAALPTSLKALTNLSWTDNTNGAGAVQFTEPTVANGHVYAAGESIVNNNFIPQGHSQGIPGLCGTVLIHGGGCYGEVTVWYP